MHIRVFAASLPLFFSAAAMTATTPEFARAIAQELAPLPTFDDAAFTAKALEKFQRCRPPAFDKAAIERRALKDLGWDKPPTDRSSPAPFVPIVKEKLNREFPPAARLEIYRQAKDLHGVHNKGDQVSLKVQRGDSQMEVSGVFNGFAPGGDIAYIGPEKFHSFELPQSFLDRLDESTALERESQYIDEHFDLPREQLRKELERRYYHEFGSYDHMLQVLQEERRQLIARYNSYFDEISSNKLDKYQKKLRNPALSKAVDQFMANRADQSAEELANVQGRPLILKLLPFDSGKFAQLKAAELLAESVKTQLSELCASQRLARDEDIPLILNGSTAYSELVKKTVPELSSQLGALQIKLIVGLAVGLLAGLVALVLALRVWLNTMLHHERTRKWKVKA